MLANHAFGWFWFDHVMTQEDIGIFLHSCIWHLKGLVFILELIDLVALDYICTCEFSSSFAFDRIVLADYYVINQTKGV